MSKIINLDELLPEDLQFAYQGETYAIPGDITIEQVFRFYDLFDKMREEMAADDSPEAKAKQGKSAVERLQEELLRVFQIRQPHLETLPFGIRGTATVVSHILASLNPTGDDEEGKKKLPPTSRRSSTAGKKRPSSTPRPRSRGSRRS